MVALLIGAGVLFVLFAGARAFERASVTSIKALLLWIAALGGLSLALLLILAGRLSLAVSGLVLVGPLLYREWMAMRSRNGPRSAQGAPPRSRTAMTRAEAYEVLGLRPGASETEIREAHRRLMRGAHPDAGGSDWLASRVNQARDVLIG